jgi:hypothetical protein
VTASERMIKWCGAPRPAPSSCLLIKATRWFPAVIRVTDSVITLPIMADHTLLGPFTPCDWIAPPGQFLLALHYFPPGSMSVRSENKSLVTKIVRMTKSALLLSCRAVLHSWLLIQGSRVRFPGTTKNLVGLERGPVSLVSTTEELLDRKVAAPV